MLPDPCLRCPATRLQLRVVERAQREWLPQVPLRNPQVLQQLFLPEHRVLVDAMLALFTGVVVVVVFFSQASKQGEERERMR